MEKSYMPIKPEPFICRCPKCNWEIGIAPKSDALAPWEHFSSCPKCKYKELISEPLGVVKMLLWRLSGKMADSF